MKKKYDDQIVSVLAAAAEKAFLKLFQEHHEHFYYCSLIMAEEGVPFITASSEESLKQIINNENITDADEILDYKWSYADSPYCAYGFEEFFGEVGRLYRERWNNEADDKVYEKQVDLWLGSMEETMRQLDEQGIFGTGEDRIKTVINAEIMPPDHTNTKRAKRLNPKKAISRWLKEAAEPEDKSLGWGSVSLIRCTVSLIRPVNDLQTVMNLRNVFAAETGTGEFLKSCKKPPVVMQENMLYGDILSAFQKHPELKNYVKIVKKKKTDN